MPTVDTIETFQPVAVSSPSKSPWSFWLRCIVDLQLMTIVQYLKPALAPLKGAVLDVGAGQSPWKSWLNAGASYHGIDIGNAADFGMQALREDIIYYDGNAMPLSDGQFDAVLCIEVLEHASNPILLLSEIYRVMADHGQLILTVPWSARRHHIPYDYHRFSREQLLKLLQQAGFYDIEIKERGNDIGVVANKLTVMTLRFLRVKQLPWLVLLWPLVFFYGALSVFFIAMAHLSFLFNFGSLDDPLGYFVSAKKYPLAQLE